MRAKIKVRKTSQMPLAIDYPYWLASAVIKKLDEINPDLADLIHSHRGFKHYTLSNLILQDQKKSNDGLQFKNAIFYISSPMKEFIKKFSGGFLTNPDFSLGHTEFTVEGVELVEKEDFKENMVFQTISPIYVKTRRKVEGELTDWDLYPTDGKFYRELYNNLVRRYKDFHGKEPSDDFFEIEDVYTHKRRRYTINGDNRRCSEMVFEVSGCEEVVEFAYQSGFGQKNSMGFGCVKEVEEEC